MHVKFSDSHDVRYNNKMNSQDYQMQCDLC